MRLIEFFNFELDRKSYANNKIVIDESIANRIPHDYREFLETYVDVIPSNEESSFFYLCDKKIFCFILTLVEIQKREPDIYPNNYMIIGEDYHF